VCVFSSLLGCDVKIAFLVPLECVVYFLSCGHLRLCRTCSWFQCTVLLHYRQLLQRSLQRNALQNVFLSQIIFFFLSKCVLFWVITPCNVVEVRLHSLVAGSLLFFLFMPEGAGGMKAYGIV
jgi:hypothetical protein